MYKINYTYATIPGHKHSKLHYNNQDHVLVHDVFDAYLEHEDIYANPIALPQLLQKYSRSGVLRDDNTVVRFVTLIIVNFLITHMQNTNITLKLNKIKTFIFKIIDEDN